MSLFSKAADSSSSDEIRSLIGSECDCRMSIALVERDARMHYARKYLCSTEAAWRTSFEVGARFFASAVERRSSSLQKQATEAEKESYQRFLEWAGLISSWYSDLWTTVTNDVSYWFCISSLYSVEMYERTAIAAEFDRDAVCLGGIFQHVQRGLEGWQVHEAKVQHATGVLDVLQYHELTLAMFLHHSNKLWASYALDRKAFYAQHLFQLSELEAVKYRWSLMYRLEQAARRHIIWQSLVSACHLVESWERLYILHSYARKTGELLWFHDEQRCLVVVDDEHKSRKQLFVADERFKRRQLYAWMFSHAVAAYAKQSLLRHKELINRCFAAARSLSHMETVRNTAKQTSEQILTVLCQHVKERNMLSDSERSARCVLEEFLLSNHVLGVQHWLQTEEAKSHAIAAQRAMVPFLGYLDDVVGGNVEAHKQHEQDVEHTWNLVYDAPMVPSGVKRKQEAESFAVMKSPIPASPPPRTAETVTRQLELLVASSAATTVSPQRYSPPTPRRRGHASSNRGASLPAANIFEVHLEDEEEEETAVRSNNSSQRMSLQSSMSRSTTPVGNSEDDMGPLPVTPFFASGATPSFALESVALAYDEDRERAFLISEAWNAHLSLMLHGGLPSLEEMSRWIHERHALELMSNMYTAFLFDGAAASVTELETKHRRRIGMEEMFDITFTFHASRLQRSTIDERQRTQLRLGAERQRLMGEYIFACFYDGAVLIARTENKSFAAVMAQFEAELLRLNILEQQRALTPAISRLKSQCAHLEQSEPSATPVTWYDRLSEEGDPAMECVDEYFDDQSPVGSLAFSEHDNSDVNSASQTVAFERDDRDKDDAPPAAMSPRALRSEEALQRLLSEEAAERLVIYSGGIRGFVVLSMNTLPFLEELQRYEVWNQFALQHRHLCRAFIAKTSIAIMVSKEASARHNLMFEYETSTKELRRSLQQRSVLLREAEVRRELSRYSSLDMLNLKTDVLFTLFYERAVELAHMEDNMFMEIRHMYRRDTAGFFDRKKLFFGLRVADGVFVQDPTSARSKEMYYHLRVTESFPPARPLIQKGDIILSVQGVQVVTLSALKHALKLVNSNVAHFTIVRARDGVTTTVTLTGVYREDPPSRSQSPSAIQGGRFV